MPAIRKVTVPSHLPLMMCGNSNLISLNGVIWPIHCIDWSRLYGQPVMYHSICIPLHVTFHHYTILDVFRSHLLHLMDNTRP